MIERYYDFITRIENFFDFIMIVDDKCIVRVCKSFTKKGLIIDEKKSIGKTPWDLSLNLSEEDSTLYRAVKYGETTINRLNRLKDVSGQEDVFLDSTFPIRENNKIIGAINIAKYIDETLTKNFINVANMTFTHTDTNDLYRLNHIIGNSEEIQLMKNRIQKISMTNSNVLIYGESGTGKEMVAQSIHSESSRKYNCFIAQNCAAIPHTLLESIFFGTTKGSFTGAENKPGIFELANGGTLFLDEINSMDLSMQAKLLRAIEEKRITRIGGLENIKIDVRIIAAINETPEDCMRERRMREDLFYRLSCIQIKVPPLRERKEDIPHLTEHFIELYNREMQSQIEGVTSEVLELFTAYPWPGNIREFKNVIESAFNFTTTRVICKDDLPDFIKNNLNRPDKDSENLNEALEAFERDFILRQAKGKKSLTELADSIWISRQVLNYKLKKYNLDLKFD